MADNSSYMDDKLYEAARSKGSQSPFPDDEEELYYLRVSPDDGSNALHVAAEHGNHKFIEKILSRVGTQILCQRNLEGRTPLHLAAESGSKETVEVILTAHDAYALDGCCWRERDGLQGDTPLHIALRYAHDHIAVLMLERDIQYLVTLNNDVGESLAYVAAHNFCPVFLRKILDADRDGVCSISFSGPFGQTAFHPARRLTGEMISISIERRRHLLKAQDHKGKTVLHYCVEEERGPMVEILLKADNTISYLHDNDGMTALHMAASRGFFEIIQMILELSPQSIKIRDKHRGQTALHVLKMDEYYLHKCLKNTRMRELINQVDNDANTPLHLALMRSDFATADKLLLVDGINWRLTNKLGYSPLDLCSSNGQIHLKLRRLEEEYKGKEGLKMDLFFHKNVFDADDVLDHYSWEECLSFKGPQGENILHIASRDGNMNFINRVNECDNAHALLLSGQNSKGETSLHLAAEYGQLEVVQFILSLANSHSNETSPSTVVAIENNCTELMSINCIGHHVKPWRIRSVNGDTPAHKAIRNRRTEVALVLLQHDPELINVTNDANESLLYVAADSNCFSITGWILWKERDNDNTVTSGSSGQNYFHANARSPIFYTSGSLIEKQPHLLGKKDDNGKTPLHHAIEGGGNKTARWLLSEDKSAAFVYDNEGFTPLLRAAVLGNSRCVTQILTSCPQSAKLRDLRCNKTVLHLAKMPLFFHQVCLGHEVMKKLVNETDKDGNTALHCAILDGDVDKALVLLQTEGINWAIRNNEQKTPIDLCRQLHIDGETKQRAISIALRSHVTGEGMNVRLRGLGTLIKTLLLAYNNMITTDENLKNMVDKIVVAAALLVTITFAAAFTIPGGYDQNTGDAMLMKKAAIQIFIASDVLAMLMSISILIWYTLGGRRTNLRKLAMDCIIMLLISLMATVVSFISGVFAIGWHAKSAVIVPIVIAAFLNFFITFRFEYFEFNF